MDWIPTKQELDEMDRKQSARITANDAEVLKRCAIGVFRVLSSTSNDMQIRHDMENFLDDWKGE